MKRFLVLLPLVLTLACSRPGGALIGITSSRSGSGDTRWLPFFKAFVKKCK